MRPALRRYLPARARFSARAWLRVDALSQLTRRSTRLAFDSGYETVLATKARRDRLDAASGDMAADSEFTPVVQR